MVDNATRFLELLVESAKFDYIDMQMVPQALIDAGLVNHSTDYATTLTEKGAALRSLLLSTVKLEISRGVRHG